MPCPKHPRLRSDYRCPCNPPEGQRGTHAVYRVNAIRAYDGVIWLEVLSDGTWFPAMAQKAAHENFLLGGKPYRPVAPA